jgi:hypothetical protein
LSKTPHLCKDFISEHAIKRGISIADTIMFIVDEESPSSKVNNDTDLLAFALLQEESWLDKKGYYIHDSCSVNKENKPKTKIFKRILLLALKQEFDYVKTYIPVTLMKLFLNLKVKNGIHFSVSFGNEKPNKKLNKMARELMPIWNELADIGKKDGNLYASSKNLTKENAEKLDIFIDLMETTGHQTKANFYKDGIPVSCAFTKRGKKEMTADEIKKEKKRVQSMISKKK